MPELSPALLPFLLFVAALLYSAAGQGGGSAYLAVMALVGLPPETMKPAALFLNVLVAGIALLRFARAGSVSWKLFWPFGLASVPFAYLGGLIILPPDVYRPMVAVALLFAAFSLVRTPRAAEGPREPAPGLPVFAAGSGIGLLSGLTGIGGGVFLTPLLLSAGWAGPRAAAGVSAAFILLNSVAGLLGHLSGLATLPRALPAWAAAAMLGGWIGAGYGSRYMEGHRLRWVLMAILCVAAWRILAG